MTVMARELLKQLFRRPFTNPFPARHAPASVVELLKAVEAGEVELNPPVPVPPDFRGCITYDGEKCTGCRLCLRVCPASAIEFIPEEKKISIHLSRCIFCAQCNEICPKDCLGMSDNFLLSCYDRHSDAMVVNPVRKKEDIAAAG